jgi:nucleotide-binding universal stress UspA family protein
VLFESAAEGIVRTAEEREATLIAMVTHGYSGLRRWALGSVTDKVVSATSTPVFVLRGSDMPVATEPPAFKRILVPLDGSDFARQALSTAAELATHMRADMHLLHALPSLEEYPALVRASVTGPQFADAMQKSHTWAREHLAQAARDIQHAEVKVTTQVVKGYPAEVIIQTAAQQQSNLIVMATHGYSGLKRWALGSIADKVLHATSTPLVLVRASE